VSSTEGAPPTQRCPRCRRNLGQGSFSASGWCKSGAYCRSCQVDKTREYRRKPRYQKIVPAAELAKLRASVACLVCGAVPEPNKRGRVVAKHRAGCTAVDERLRHAG
jgi:hypothetical protein